MPFKGKYTVFERLNISNIYNLFLGLPPQQQTLALVGSAIVVLLIILLPISFATGKISKMEESLKESRSAIGNIVEGIDSYENMRNKDEEMKKLLSTGYDAGIKTSMDALAKKSNIEIGSISGGDRPVPTDELDELSVEMRFKGVTLSQLVDFLYSIENDEVKLRRVNDLSTNTVYGKSDLFDVKLRVTTYRLPEKKPGKR